MKRTPVTVLPRTEVFFISPSPLCFIFPFVLLSFYFIFTYNKYFVSLFSHTSFFIPPTLLSPLPFSRTSLHCSLQVLQSVTVFVVSTYTDGLPPDSAKWFCKWLCEAVDDFRVSKFILSQLKFTVFALGDSIYADHYNSTGKNLHDWLRRLAGTPVYPLGQGDENVAQSINGGNMQTNRTRQLQ